MAQYSLFRPPIASPASHDKGRWYRFQLGTGQVIRGYDEVVPGMCVGEKWKITMPPSKAYGSGGYGMLVTEKM